MSIYDLGHQEHEWGCDEWWCLSHHWKSGCDVG